MLSLPVVSPDDRKAITSAVLENISVVDDESPPSPTLNMLGSRQTSDSGHRP